MSSAPSILMALDLSGPGLPPRWPSGIWLVPFATADAPEVHALMLTAYADGGGGVPASFSQWWQATSTDEEFDPALCFVARADYGAIAGFALCWTSGFVKDLVVRADHRRRGIGEALLRTAQATLRDRGHRRLALKVAADNPSGARRLYERLGFAAV